MFNVQSFKQSTSGVPFEQRAKKRTVKHLLSKYERRSSLIEDSIILQHTLVREIGLELQTLQDLPFLKMGVTDASFHSLGTVQVDNKN